MWIKAMPASMSISDLIATPVGETLNSGPRQHKSIFDSSPYPINQPTTTSGSRRPGLFDSSPRPGSIFGTSPHPGLNLESGPRQMGPLFGESPM